MVRLRLAFAAGLVLLVACNNGTLQKPVIKSFTADPSSLPAGGGSTTLKWDVSGAETISIDGGVGAVTGSSSKTVSVTATTTFTLTATNLLGSTSERVTVTVAAQPAAKLEVAPKTANLNAGGPAIDLTAILTGSSDPISWSLSPNVGSLSATNGAKVKYTPPASIASKTDVTVTATAGKLTATAALTVNPVDAPLLTVSPKTATLTAGGAKATFTATLKNATGDIAWKLSPELGTLSAKTGASVDYTPPPSVDKETAVTLTATSGSLSDSATITVKPGASTGITVNGKVSDIGGTGLANIPVRIVDANGPKNLVNTDSGGNFSVSGVKTPYSVSAVPQKTTALLPVTWEGVTRPDPKLVVENPNYQPCSKPAPTLSGKISPPVGAGNSASVIFAAPGLSSYIVYSNAGTFLSEGANAYQLNVEADDPYKPPWCQDSYTGSLLYLESDGKGWVRTAIISNVALNSGTSKTIDITSAPAKLSTLSGKVTFPADFVAGSNAAEVSAIFKVGGSSILLGGYAVGSPGNLFPDNPNYEITVPVLEGVQYRVFVFNYLFPYENSFVYSDLLAAGGTANLSLPNFGRAISPNGGTASSRFPTFEQTPVAGSNLYQVFIKTAELGPRIWNGNSVTPQVKLPDLPEPARLVSKNGYDWDIAAYRVRDFRGIDDLLDGRLIKATLGGLNPDLVASGYNSGRYAGSFNVP